MTNFAYTSTTVKSKYRMRCTGWTFVILNFVAGNTRVEVKARNKWQYKRPARVTGRSQVGERSLFHTLPALTVKKRWIRKSIQKTYPALNCPYLGLLDWQPQRGPWSSLCSLRKHRHQSDTAIKPSVQLKRKCYLLVYKVPLAGNRSHMES